MLFKPYRHSLIQHKIPEWYQDAKLGIFIHWGLYSVPAWAEPGDINQLIKEKGHGPHFTNNPYAEWYHNTYQIPGSPAQQYHNEKYGDEITYKDFVPMFEECSKDADMNLWASLFKQAGAEYVVMVTKHHDGYCLWPTEQENPVSPNYHVKRDFVGELADCCRVKGMKFGIYYSGLLDWSVRNFTITDSYTFTKCYQQNRKYIRYAVGQIKELIEKYKPAVLWNDIGFPWGYNLKKLFSFYYNTVSKGVINDRWKQDFVPKASFLQPLVKRICRKIDKNTHGIDFGSRKDKKFWYDYDTMEYATHDDIQSDKWELIRGVGHSFGYNQMETEEDFLSGLDLVWMLVDTVSKNGNLLLNIGPKPDGSIPREQYNVLTYLGEWMEYAGEGIYGSRPNLETALYMEHHPFIRYTKNDRNTFVFIKGKKGQEFRAVGIDAASYNVTPLFDISKASLIVDDHDISVLYEEDYVAAIKLTKK